MPAGAGGGSRGTSHQAVAGRQAGSASSSARRRQPRSHGVLSGRILLYKWLSLGACALGIGFRRTRPRRLDAAGRLDGAVGYPHTRAPPALARPPQ
jgi:hypothetical protein